MFVMVQSVDREIIWFYWIKCVYVSCMLYSIWLFLLFWLLQLAPHFLITWSLCFPFPVSDIVPFSSLPAWWHHFLFSVSVVNLRLEMHTGLTEAGEGNTYSFPLTLCTFQEGEVTTLTTS